MTAPERRVVVMPKNYSPAAIRDRWTGCTVEVQPVKADSNNALSCRLLDGPDEGRELWLHPTWLRLPDIDTGGEW